VESVKDVISGIWDLFDDEKRKKFLLIVALALLSGLLDLLGIAAFSVLFSSLGSSERSAAVSENVLAEYVIGFISTVSFQGLLLTTLLILATGVLMRAVVSKLSLDFAYGVEARVSKQVFESYLTAKAGHASAPSNSDLVKRLMYETSQVTINIIQPLVNVSTSLVVIFFIISGLVLINTIASIFIIFGGSLFYFFIIKSNKEKLGSYGAKVSDANTIRTSIVRGVVECSREILVYRAQKGFSAKFSLANDAFTRNQARALFTAQVPRYVLEILGYGFMFYILFVSSLGDQSPLNSISDISAFAFAFYRLLPTIQILIANLSSMKYYERPFMDIFSMICETGGRSKSSVAREVIASSQSCSAQLGNQIAIKFENVSFGYPDKPIFKDVNFTIYRGDHVAIIGSNGVGKSTLLDLIAGIKLPGAGFVSIVGCNTLNGREDLECPNVQVAYVSQKSGLMSGSLQDNVAFGLSEEDIDKDRLAKVLEIVGLDESGDKRLSSTSRMDLGDLGSAVSGGQRQRIALARALYFETDVLVLDEYTAALDASGQSDFTQIMRFLFGKTVVFVIHDEDLLPTANRIFHITGDGSVQERATSLLGNSRACRP
jgi:ATP-binding cassette, subfamily B, bacterial PglK